MITRKLIYPAIALATIVTMTAEEIDPAKAIPVEEALVEESEAISEPREKEAEENNSQADAQKTGESTEEPTTELTGEMESEEEQADPKLLEESPPKDPTPGLVVRVEKMQSGGQIIDPAQVRVLAPFPAKLLAKSPTGWRIEPSDSAPHFTREVELAPGKHISLTVRPHVLVPDANGSTVFSIPEPGYSAPMGYHQNATVGAILSSSIGQLEKDASELGGAIDQLQQLLVSLPKPEQAPAAPEKVLINKRPR